MNTPTTGPSRPLTLRPLAAVLPALVSGLLVVALTTACSVDDAPGGASPAETAAPMETATQAAPETAPPLVTSARVVQVVGRMPKKRRNAVRRDVTKVVNGWWRAAYLDGSYPRTSFRASYPGFSRGAKQRARRDERLMSNADIGASIDSVESTRRRVLLDVLAIRGRPTSVTARIDLRFRTTGQDGQRVKVKGRLFLTRQHGSWQVFGYDVTKGARL